MVESLLSKRAKVNEQKMAEKVFKKVKNVQQANVRPSNIAALTLYQQIIHYSSR